jgi:hypothetical protein
VAFLLRWSGSYGRWTASRVRACRPVPTRLGVVQQAQRALDRYLWRVGEPQIYGTQLHRDDAGAWTIESIDEEAVSDEERARWDVPPLAEAKQRAIQANQRKSGSGSTTGED